MVLENMPFVQMCGRSPHMKRIEPMSFVRRHWVWLLAGLALVLVIVLIVSTALSLPPRSFTILTGRQGGAYYEFAQEYQKIAADYGFDLQIQQTAGSVETLQLLEEGAAPVGFVQGGVASGGDAARLSTLASVFREPVWILYRQELDFAQPPDSLPDLAGLRIGIGEAGSGGNWLARLMLTDTGVSEANATLVELPSQTLADGLRAGSIDAAFFVVALSSPLIQELLVDPNLALLNLARADAFARRYNFLSRLTLPEGTINMQSDIPPADVAMVATVANLVVSNDIHPDLLRLLTIAAVLTHEKGNALDGRFEFPNVQYADLPVGKEALAYLNRIKSGESILDNYFPFWAAALIDRYLIFVVPIALLLVPMLSRSPLLYQFFIRNSITRWYRTVRQAELRANTVASFDIDAEIRRLLDLDLRLTKELSVGNLYWPDVYQLRNSIDLVIRKLERRKQELQSVAAETPPPVAEKGVASNTHESI
jgi:TRAP transporter TAXI family solute receptor